ncbi:hypothetical protein CLOSYM_04713, partial [[Clostridium] symbiosum ATCC 14940]
MTGGQAQYGIVHLVNRFAGQTGTVKAWRKPVISALTVAVCSAIFPEVWSHRFGPSWPKFGRWTRDESFIYAMSADERGRDLRVSSPASPARAPAVSSVLALPGGKDTRSGNADRAYNTLH